MDQGSNNTITKVYDLQMVGGKEAYNTLQGINQLFKEIATNKVSINGTFNINADFSKFSQLLEVNKELISNIKILTTEMSKFGQIGSQMTKSVADGMEKANMSNIKNVMAFRQFSAVMAENKVQTQALNKEILLQAKYVNAVKDSYEEMSAEMGLNTIELHKYTLEQTRTDENAIKLIERNKELQASMLEIDVAQGKFGRNVGNYAQGILEAQRLKEEMNQLAIAGKKDSTEFLTMSENLNTLTSSMGGTRGQLSWVVGEMESLAAAGQKDSAEFERLAAIAAELKAEMAGVGTSIKEAAAKMEAGALSMEKMHELMKEIGSFAITFFGVQAGMEFIGGISEEFGKADQAAVQLENTLENLGNTQAIGRLNEEAEKLSHTFNYLDKYDVQNVFTKLLSYGKLTEEQMHELIPVIIDFAAKNKTSLEASTDLITKALEGNARGLKQYGINIKDAAQETETIATPAERLSLIMKELKPRVEGAAAAFGTSFEGKVGGIKKEIRDIELSIADFFIAVAGIEKQNMANAAAAKREADEAQRLVDEYEHLSQKVDQTSDDKKRLNEITTMLAATFGDSVVSINKETGALQLNLEATKALIKQRILLADNEASRVALKYNNADEGLKKNLEETILHQKIIEQLQQTPGTDQKVNDEFKKIARLRSEWQILMRTKILALQDLEKMGYKEEDIDRLFSNKPIQPFGDANAGGKKKKAEKIDSSIPNPDPYGIWSETADHHAQEMAEKEAARLKALEEKFKAFNEGILKDKLASDMKMDAEILALSEKLKKGEIDQEEYQKQKKELTDKYNIEEINATIDKIEQEIRLHRFAAEQEKKLIDEVEQYRKNAIEAQIKANEDSSKKTAGDQEDIYKELKQQGIELATSISNTYMSSVEKQDAYREEMASRNISYNMKLAQASAQSQAEQLSLQRQHDLQERELNKQKMADEHKRAQTQMILSYVIGLAKDWELGWPAGAVAAAGQTLALAFEEAELAKAPQYGEGGEVPNNGGMFAGRSHSSGGTPFTYRGRSFEAEAGELAIINKRSSASNQVMTVTGTPKQIASGINSWGGGYDFAPGAKMYKFEWGGSLGNQIQPPSFVNDHYTARASSDNNLSYIYNMVMENNRSLQAHAAAIHNRIDNLQVHINPHAVTDYQKSYTKSVKVGKL